MVDRTNLIRSIPGRASQWVLLSLLGSAGISANILSKYVSNLERSSRKPDKSQGIEKNLERSLGYDLSPLSKKTLPYSIQDLRAGLDNASISVSDVAILSSQSLRKVPELIAVFDIEDVLSQAAMLSEELSSGTIRSELHGIPIAVSDSFQVKGLTGVSGVPDLQDSPPVKILREAGALILCKTRRRAMNDTYHVPHPIDRDRSVQGSAPSESVLVSLKCVPLALAFEEVMGTNLSASLCGVFSLRVTSRRTVKVLNTGWPGHDSTIGVVASNTQDIVLVMARLCSNAVYNKHPSIPPLVWKPYAADRPFRIGYILEDEYWKLPRAMTNAITDAVQKMHSSGHCAVPVKLPPLQDLLISLVKVYYLNCKQRIPGVLRRLYALYMEKRFGFKEAFYAKAVEDNSGYVYVNHAIEINRVKAKIREIWQEHSLDAIITPYHAPATFPEFEGEILKGDVFSALVASLNCPSANVPCGNIQEDEEIFAPVEGEQCSVALQHTMAQSKGLPKGVQVMCLPFQEEMCLSIVNIISK